MLTTLLGINARSDGFALVELLVVIVILGILISIAVPTFLSQQDKAKDSAINQDLNTAYKVAKSEQTTSNADFPSEAVLTARIAQSEPQINVANVSSEATVADALDVLANGQVGVYSTDSDGLTLLGKSESGQGFDLVITNNAPQNPLVQAIP